jgi:hypothetical protein
LRSPDAGKSRPSAIAGVELNQGYTGRQSERTDFFVRPERISPGKRFGSSAVPRVRFDLPQRIALRRKMGRL